MFARCQKNVGRAHCTERNERLIRSSQQFAAASTNINSSSSTSIFFAAYKCEKYAKPRAQCILEKEGESERVNECKTHASNM